MKPPSSFPPRPRSFRGRQSDLSTLVELIRTSHPTNIALVGSGGSGKSTLAAALGHALCGFFKGQVYWFRIGAWDARTLFSMIASGFGRGHETAHPERWVHKVIAAKSPMLVVLDNHEDDKATAELLDPLRDLNVTFVLTARRCLLSGVTVFPVIPPLVATAKSPFPRVEALTRLLRWNPVALDLADALVQNQLDNEKNLHEWLMSRGILRVKPIAHEDDLPEVGLMVERVSRELSAAGKRMLRVLAHMGGDHIGGDALAALSKTKSRALETITKLKTLRIVQEPFLGRFTLHATVRHAVRKHTEPLGEALHNYYLDLLEKDPSRRLTEQTHLFAAMDYAQEKGDLATILRVQTIADAQ